LPEGWLPGPDSAFFRGIFCSRQAGKIEKSLRDALNKADEDESA
jgi:hypothetical protein